jgi:hypothetical protein
MSTEAARLSPVATADRIRTLDILRGLALLGILVMNIQSFSMPGAVYFFPIAYGDFDGANHWACRVVVAKPLLLQTPAVSACLTAIVHEMRSVHVSNWVVEGYSKALWAEPVSVWRRHRFCRTKVFSCPVENRR